MQEIKNGIDRTHQNDSHEISVFFYIDSFCWMYIEQKSCNDTTS